MTDMVARLRYEARTAEKHYPEDFSVSPETALAAADEIEKLRKQVEGLQLLASAPPASMTTPIGLQPIDADGMRRVVDALAGWKGVAEAQALIIKSLEKVRQYDTD